MSELLTRDLDAALLADGPEQARFTNDLLEAIKLQVAKVTHCPLSSLPVLVVSLKKGTGPPISYVDGSGRRNHITGQQSWSAQQHSAPGGCQLTRSTRRDPGASRVVMVALSQRQSLVLPVVLPERLVLGGPRAAGPLCACN